MAIELADHIMMPVQRGAMLRKLTNGFQPPVEACNTYRALFAGLSGLEEDLHIHINLENSVLFPAAKAMQEI